MIYDLQSLGVKQDGNPASAAKNTDICLKVFADARGGNPGPIVLGMGGVMPVLNGKLELAAPNMILRGEGTMGAFPAAGSTSTIKGFGPGDILKVSQGGCAITGMAWAAEGQTQKKTGEKEGTNDGDAFIRITETQVSVKDNFFDSPNIGIAIQARPGSFIGQTWMRDILMTGLIKYAGIDLNNLGGACFMDNIRTFNGTMKPEDPQPRYGILVRSAGELMMSSCDIDNCGTNLAIVPGIDGAADTFVQNLDIMNCDFDNGNGAGQVWICPFGNSFVLDTKIANAWHCSVNNGLQLNGSTWPGNGITIDGSHSRPRAGFPSICGVSMTGSSFNNAVGHCGMYANTVTGLSVVGCSARANYTGFQTKLCTGVITACTSGAYGPGALGTNYVGNRWYGVLLETSVMAFNPLDNALVGNGVAPYFIKP